MNAFESWTQKQELIELIANYLWKTTYYIISKACSHVVVFIIIIIYLTKNVP